MMAVEDLLNRPEWFHTLWHDVSYLDHSQECRDDSSYRELWKSPFARLIRVDEKFRIETPIGGVKPRGEYDERAVFLGIASGQPWFAVRVSSCQDAVDLRSLKASALEVQAATVAQAILHWHASAKFCPTCSGTLHSVNGGFQAVCAECGRQNFPRTDPAVIVGVTDSQDRLLLAHHVAWAPKRVSILAGFVESGESAEQACHREISEESNLDITHLGFFGTQPWPFPRSLMLGFTARTLNPDSLEPDGNELEWARFYSRKEVIICHQGGKLLLPTNASLASRIIHRWLVGKEPF